MGCGGAPKVPVILWSVERQSFNGVDATGNPSSIDGNDARSDKYVCTTPEGYNILITWIKNHSK